MEVTAKLSLTELEFVKDPTARESIDVRDSLTARARENRGNGIFVGEYMYPIDVELLVDVDEMRPQ